jgi:putative transcriptional regulator
MINSKLREYRQKAKLSQEKLARAVNVSLNTIYAYEKGLKVPSLTNAFKLADFFGVTIEELFPQQEDTTDSKKPVGV